MMDTNTLMRIDKIEKDVAECKDIIKDLREVVDSLKDIIPDIKDVKCEFVQFSLFVKVKLESICKEVGKIEGKCNFRHEKNGW